MFFFRSWLRNQFDELTQLIVLVQVNILKRLDKMSVDAQKAQQDLDALTAFATTTIPTSIKLINDLVADNARLRAGQPSQMDPVAVEADVAAINQQLTDLQTKLAATPDPAPPSP